MYDAVPDPYCYPGTTVLKNVPDLRTQADLDRFEAAATLQRADEPLPRGRLGIAHYRAIHHHLFRDVYRWAGRFRTVRISKDGSAFCYPEHIDQEMQRLFAKLKADAFLRGRDADAFAREGAAFLSTLNAIHPFREGNGRTQTTFFALLSDHAGRPLNLDHLIPEPFLAAMVASFKGNELPLVRQIRALIA